MKLFDGDIYVINQPKFLVTSIVLVDVTSFPLSETIHKNLCKLSEVSDITFIYSTQHYNYGVNIKKLSSLYQASCWTVSSGSIGLGMVLMKVLNYHKQVFDKHITYCLLNLSDLENSMSEYPIDILRNPGIVNFNKPVFKISRLSSKELYECYREDEYEIRAIPDYSKSSILSDLFCGYFSPAVIEKEKDMVTDTDLMFNTWKTDSTLIMLSKLSVFNILKFYNSIEISTFLKTFTNPDLKGIVVNLIKRLGLDFIDDNIENLKI